MHDVRATQTPVTLAMHGFFLGREWRGRSYLISPFFDLALTGGVALFTLAALILFLPAHAKNFDHQKLYITTAIGWIVFLVNDPHFMASYQLLYKDFPEKLLRFRNNRELWTRYIVAGIVAPSLMGIYFLYGLSVQRMELFDYAYHGMLYLVGWHYAKQAFGIFIMLSAMKKVYYNKWQRRFLVFNSYVVWVCYCIGVVTDNAPTQASFETALGFHLPEWFNAFVGVTMISNGLLALIVIIWDKKHPSVTALLGYCSMYYFLLAAAFNPLWIMLYPVFHSLQYLLFIYSYKRGETQIALSSAGGSGEEVRKIRNQLLRFVLGTFISGILFFEVVPDAIEALINPGKNIIFPMVMAFTVFINVHHYFIDNVIWRKEHPEISKYLFYRS